MKMQQQVNAFLTSENIQKIDKQQPLGRLDLMKNMQDGFSYESIRVQQKFYIPNQKKHHQNHVHTQKCAHDHNHNKHTPIHHNQTSEIQHIQVNKQFQMNNNSFDNQNQSHNQNHNHNHNHNLSKQRRQKNPCIIIYVVFTALVCWYLMLYYLNSQLDGFKKTYVNYAISFTILMSLWAYYKTITISNQPSNLKNQPIFYKNYQIDQVYQYNAKLCKICDNYKFPRISHCSQCGTCVYKLDHHCIWSQNCIGYKNQKTFYLFTLYMFLSVMQYIRSSYSYFFILYDKPSFWHTNSFSFYFLWIFANLSLIFVGIMITMLIYVHTNLIFTNTTTLDLIRNKNCFPIPFLQFRNKSLNQINYFDRGQIANIAKLFGNSLLTCWIPTERIIYNEITPQYLNPQPTKYQLNIWNVLQSNDSSLARSKKRENMSNLEALKGKKINIHNNIITLN